MENHQVLFGGVRYEDIKNNWEENCEDIVRLFNIILTNKKFPISWKHAIIQRIPKKNFNKNDLSTLRDISLLPTSYKVFSRCFCNRLIEFISNEISFWQRAYLEKHVRQELILSLITKIDDLKHLSTEMYVTFIDFADAFGSVSHEFIFDSLKRFNIPETYYTLIKDIYKHSCFQVIGKTKLSTVFYIIRGTKTGDPLSTIIFIIVIDCIFKSTSLALVTQNIENEKMLNPLPVQGFADDIAIVTHDERSLNEMTDVSEPIMQRAKLDVKALKCAVLYGRKSGNNWYTTKNDKKPNIVVQNKNIKVLKRNESYEYSGKLITINGDNPKQVSEISPSHTYRFIMNEIHY